MRLSVTNLTGDTLKLPYLGLVIPLGDTKTISCAQADLSRYTDLHDAVAVGKASYTVVPSANELASSILVAGLPVATDTLPGLQTAQNKRSSTNFDYPIRVPPAATFCENTTAPIPRALASLLAEATVVLPLREVDRYYDSVAGLWKTKNFGTLRGGAILGDGTTVTTPVQLPYTPGRKGLRSASLGAGDTGVLRLPVAWIDAMVEFTVLIRYQHPHNHINYAAYLVIGAEAAGSDGGKFGIRQNGVDPTQAQVNGVAAGFQIDCVSPSVMVCAAATGTTGNVDTWLDGTKVNTRAKVAGAVAGTIDHVIGGAYIGTAYYAYPNFNVLDVVVWSRKLTDAEIATITQGYQFTDTPVVDILAGQSNMLGSGLVSEAAAPNLSSVLGYMSDQSAGSTWSKGWSQPAPVPNNGNPYYGPELTIAAAKPAHYLVKNARNGSSVVTWSALDQAAKVDLMDGLLRAMFDLSCRPIFNSFVWLQGENDAQSSGQASTYQANLAVVLTNYRYMTRTPTLRAVIGKLNSQAQYATGGSAMPYWATIQAAEAALVAADTYARLVDLDSCNLRITDYTHYPGAEIQKVGALLAAQIP